ncbi:hypothetical protein MHYP_G00061380 [Metynnis hypsauchen]
MSYSGHAAIQGQEPGKNLTGCLPREKDWTVRVTLLSSWPDGTDPSDVHTVMKQTMRFTALRSRPLAQRNVAPDLTRFRGRACQHHRFTDL